MITLSIIGVVAALTIPSIIQKNQEKETVTRLKKSYNTLSNAFSLAIIEYGEPSNWGIQRYSDNEGNEASGSANILVAIFSKYLNTIRVCYEKEGCLPNITTKNLDGTNDMNYNVSSIISKLMLSDGSTLSFTGESSDCSANMGDNEELKHVCASVGVDLNGFKGPNQNGKDIFYFWISKKGIIPRGTPEDKDIRGTIKRCHTQGYQCTAWILLRENLDYLKGPINWG